MSFKIDLKKSHIQLAAAVVLVVAFAYLLFDWTMSAVIHSRKAVMVPDLKGKTLPDALTALSALNLGVKKDGEEFDQNVPAGTVLRQNPGGGMAVREGKIIRVTISQGGRMVAVPDVVGQPVRSAEIAVRSAGLSLGEESTRYSAVVPRDAVVAQDPAGASVADKDSMVNLVISQGPPPEGVVLLPGFVGKSVAAAKQWAEQNGMRVTVREDPSLPGTPGAVLRQDPPPDTGCAGLKSITVFVSANPAGMSSSLNEKMFYYEIPQGGDSRSVRLVLRDETGETEIFSGTKQPGSKLSIPISPEGKARVRVFMNNILVEEQDVK